MTASYVVYRVQDHEQRGPFKPGLSRFWADAEDKDPSLVPWYEAIPPAKVFNAKRARERIGCACESMDDLRMWFSPSEIARLERIGYRVTAFVPVRVLFVLPESHQCIVVLP